MAWEKGRPLAGAALFAKWGRWPSPLFYSGPVPEDKAPLRKGGGVVLVRSELVDRSEIEGRVEALDFEVVDLEWAGSRGRPILRLRVDRVDSIPGAGVTVDDCARVSRALEAWLDELEGVPERYVLEVSSPGIERPLTRPRDWSRFRGQRVAVEGREALVGDRKRVEGELLGPEQDAGSEDPEGATRVRIRTETGEELVLSLSEIKKAHLVHDWAG